LLQKDAFSFIINNFQTTKSEKEKKNEIFLQVTGDSIDTATLIALVIALHLSSGVRVLSKAWNIKFYITFGATWSLVAGNMRNKMCLFLFLFFMECYLGMSSFSFVSTSLVLFVFVSS